MAIVNEHVEALDNREVDVILAALRLWQHDSAHIADGDGELIGMASEHGESLTNDEIDKLCERINFARLLVLP